MVVASSKLEGLADALEMTDVIIETAKQLKASLNQAKKGNTPAALAAASATLGLSRTVVNFSRDAHILLNKSVPKWLPARAGGSASGSRAAPISARAFRPEFTVSPQRAKKTAIGRVAAASAAAAGEPAPLGSLASPVPNPAARPGYTLVVNEKTSGAGLRASAPSLLAADRERDAEDASAHPLGSLASPAPAAAAEDDPTPRDSDSSPTPTAKTKSEAPSRARPSSAPSRGRPSSAPAAKRRVSVSDAGDDDARGKLRKPRPSSARSSTKAGADADARAGARAVPRVSRPSTPRGPNDHMRRTASRSYTTETLMVKRAGIGNPVCVVHRRLDDASPEKAAEEIIELLRAVQTKLGMGAPVASLVNAKDGCELSFAQYAEPAPTPRSSTPRVFPPGSVFVALTAGEMRARAAKLRAEGEVHRKRPTEVDADDDVDDDVDHRESDDESPAPLPARRGVAIEVTREVSAADENPTTVRVAVPSYVETIGETLARVSEALRDDGVSGATCVSLHATGDDGVGEKDAATGVRTVEELVDGGRYRVRCADDLSVNDDDTSAAARKRRDEDASFEVDVAPREDPTREGATIRLPGARALSKMAREDVCERVRVAVGASTDAGDAGNAEMGLYRFDGSVIERPEEITPGMRLLYGEASADEGLPKAVVATATEVFEASASREAPKKSHAKSPTSTAAKSAAALLREEPTSTRKTRATTTTTTATLPTRAPKAASHLPPLNALPPTPPMPVSTTVIIKKNPSPTAAVRANPFAAAEASKGEEEEEDVAETSPGRVRSRKTPTRHKAKSPAKIKGIMPGFQ